MSKITVMIQARTGSRRLPRKVLAKIAGKPMIWHVINRIQKTKGVEQIILLTTNKKEDEILLNIAKDSGILGFAGSEQNVLERYYECAIKFDADPIIRITGDCPLIDPKIVQDMIKFYQMHNYDYITNTLPPTYPDGLDVEVFSFHVLKKTFFNAKLKSDLEHVTSYIRRNNKKFNVFNYTTVHDLSAYRWTVDEKNDLLFVRKIFTKMKPKKVFGMDSVLNIISKNPNIIMINSNIIRNEGYNFSRKKNKT